MSADTEGEISMANAGTEPCDIPSVTSVPADILPDTASMSPPSSSEVGSPSSNLAARRSRQASRDYTLAERDALSQVAMDVSTSYVSIVVSV